MLFLMDRNVKTVLKCGCGCYFRISSFDIMMISINQCTLCFYYFVSVYLQAGTVTTFTHPQKCCMLFHHHYCICISTFR